MMIRNEFVSIMLLFSFKIIVKTALDWQSKAVGLAVLLWTASAALDCQWCWSSLHKNRTSVWPEEGQMKVKGRPDLEEVQGSGCCIK
jgi:hypothetical protein